MFEGIKNAVSRYASPWLAMIRRGFLHGAAIPLLWLIGVYRLWFSSRYSSLDELLFSDTMWHSGRFRLDPYSWTAVALAVAFVSLGWMAIGRFFDKNRPRMDLFLPGVAFALSSYAGMMQVGASLSTARRMDPPFHYALFDALRWIVFWLAAVGILASVLRAVGVHKRSIARFSAVAGSCILVSAAALGGFGRWMGEWRDWRDARKIATAMAMDGFVKAHPDSRHVEEARRRAWAQVVAHPDLLHARLYLEHAVDWGDRIDSARILERLAVDDLRRAALARGFSEDSVVDGFWHSMVPLPGSGSMGSRIVRYRTVFEPFDPREQASALSGASRRGVFAPDTSFRPFEVMGRNRLVEDLLESQVRPWAGPQILTIAPWKSTDTVPPDIEVRLRADLVGPMEPVPCDPGCPPESERWMLPSIAYSWVVELVREGGRVHRASGTAVDSSSVRSPPQAGEEGGREGIWPDGMGLEEAWDLLRERSQARLAASLGEAWKVRANPR